MSADRMADLRLRIEKASEDCASWRAAGLGERYLETYTLMESLEAELAVLEDRAGLERRLEAERKAGTAAH